MAEAERQEILEVFKEGMDALDAALQGVEEAAAHVRVAEEGWSIIECVEHLALTEAALLRRLREAKPTDQSHADPAREEKFRALAMDRGRRIEAPEPVLPKGSSLSLAAAVEGFRAVRQDTLLFVEEFPGQLRWYLVAHPLITRPVNCYEMLLLMAMHPRRHAQQIVEMREHLSRRRSQRM